MSDVLRDTQSTAAAGHMRLRKKSAAEDAGTKVAENSGFLSVSAGVVGIVSYACTLLMANMLGTADYTQFAAATMLLGIVGIVSSALVPLPLSHNVAVYSEGSDGRRDGMAFSLFLSCLAGVTAAAFTGAVTLAFGSPALAVAVALGSLVIFLMAAPSGWLQGELRFKWYALTTIGEVVLRLAFSLVVVALAWGAVGATLGFALGAAALLVVPWSFYRDIGWRPRVLRQRWRWAETSDIAPVLAVVSVLVGIDVVVVAFLDEGSAAAGFQALATIAKGPVYVAAGTAVVAFPLLRRPGANVPQVLGAAFTSFGQLAVVAFAIIATVPHDLAALIIPDKYSGSLHLMPWLAAAGLGYAVLTVLATILLAVRAYRRCQIGLALACVMVVSGLSAGWQLGGVSGLAVGSAVAAVVAAATLALVSGPVFKAAGSTIAGGGWVGGVAALLAALVAAGQLHPVVWLILATICGVTVLAHQRGMLPKAIGSGSTRRAVDASEETSRRRHSRRRAPLKGRIAAVTNRRPSGSSTAHTTSPRLLRRPLWAAVLLGLLALGFRMFGVQRANDVFIDEVTYADFASQFAAGQMPSILGTPFFLHPPGTYALNALFIRVFGLEGHPMDLALQLRWVNAFLGVLTVVVCFLLVRRLVGVGPAVVAGVILASDPFVLRMDGRLMMETPAGLAVMSGWLLALVALDRERGRTRIWLEIGTGLVFGIAILMKDMTAAFTVVPLLAAVLWRRTVSPKTAARIVAFSVVPYALYLGLVAATGLFPQFMEQKSVGVLRMAGVVQMTGFNSVHSVSLTDRLIDLVGRFGTSYLLLGLSILAGAVAAMSPLVERRVIGLFSLFCGFVGVYSVFFGAAEEQFGYCVVLAALVSVPVAAVMVVKWRPRLRGVVVAFAAIMTVLSLLLGIQARSVVDDGLVRARDWMNAELPASSKVGLTSVTGEFALLPHENWEVLPSLQSLRDGGADYALTQGRQLSEGYGFASPAFLAWLQENAQPVFTFTGPTSGDTVVWKLNQSKLDAAVSGGLILPPVSGGYR
ncbi:glycosyltransferase family 39 protein [Paenarthrobacter sp. NPDC090517]|uniref:glycosyltransferase family 39 protein n=1 Tax=Paenarthrobacter sp. NPDC090517 TaxID=3364381 RepID=UPI003826B12E